MLNAVSVFPGLGKHFVHDLTTGSIGIHRESYMTIPCQFIHVRLFVLTVVGVMSGVFIIRAVTTF